MGYDPELYALTHTGTPGDVAFYLEACRGAKRILELGCGTGRLLAPLARAGHEITGVELDSGMLDFARRLLAKLPAALARSITLVAGDMRQIPRRDAPFDRVLIPYNGLYCLLSDEEVLACFRAARQVLGAEGALVFDAYAVHRRDLGEDSEEADPGEDHREHLATLQHRGRRLEVFERSSWDLPRQYLEARYLYADGHEGDAARQEYSIPQRYLFIDQVESLLEQAGFVVEALHGDFEGTPFCDESPHMVVVARP